MDFISKLVKQAAIREAANSEPVRRLAQKAVHMTPNGRMTKIVTVVAAEVHKDVQWALSKLKGTAPHPTEQDGQKQLNPDTTKK